MNYDINAMNTSSGYQSGGLMYFNTPTTYSPQNEGDWLSIGSITQIEGPVCGLCIDNYDEMIWLGHENVCTHCCNTLVIFIML
jgi:hypothetical protein